VAKAGRPSGHAAGFTLLELLIVVVVLALLLSFAFPALGRARAAGTHAACLAAGRQASLVILMYARDSRDRFPFAGYERVTLRVNESVSVDVGGEWGLMNGAWAGLFPDLWAGPRFSSGLHCPSQPRFDPTAVVPAPESFAFPNLWMSSSLWWDATQLHAGPAAPSLFSNAVSDVVFPDQKSLLFEQVGYCIADQKAEIWKRKFGQTPYWPSTVTAVDGSARRKRRIDGLPAVETWPFDMTTDGVRGRDWER